MKTIRNSSYVKNHWKLSKRTNKKHLWILAGSKFMEIGKSNNVGAGRAGKRKTKKSERLKLKMVWNLTNFL